MRSSSNDRVNQQGYRLVTAVSLIKENIMQDAVALVVSVPTMKFAAQIGDLEASLFYHCRPTTNLLFFFGRWTFLYTETTQIQIKHLRLSRATLKS